MYNPFFNATEGSARCDIARLALGVPRVEVALSMLREEPLSPQQLQLLRGLLSRYDLSSASFGRLDAELSPLTSTTAVGEQLEKVQQGKRRLMIVAGGQSGVDRAALDAASELTLPSRGWCPESRWAEDGVIAPRYPMQECDSGNPAVRTELNTIDSDATLVLTKGDPQDGTPLTIERAEHHGRPTLVMKLGETPDVEGFWRWIERFDIRILNIGGPRESFRPGEVYRESRAILDVILNPTTLRESASKDALGGEGQKPLLAWEVGSISAR